MNMSTRLRILAGAFALAISASAFADGPPESDGIISNPTLEKNRDVAAAQGAGAISIFMNKGAQTCDQDGKNCRSVFGADDVPDYTSLQQSSQGLTGVDSFSFMGDDGTGDGGDSKSVASQLGTLALACGDNGVKKVSGIVLKMTNCMVNTNGDAQVTVQVCTAPARNNPVSPPTNEVDCSTDPTAPNFRPPSGFVCRRPSCDTEPVGSLNGWSQPQTLVFLANLPSSATEEQKSNNGLGMIFYPPLNGGLVGSFTTDSDTMTAVKVVQTLVNNELGTSAVGLKVAFRYKTQVTKEMMIQGPSSVPNPSENTAQWDSIVKLQANEKIPQYQQQYAANGSECLQQITQGIAKDGWINVCDKNYTNESGIKPLATTAKVAAEGENCGTTPQCLNKVINTTTWTESCSADVPLAMRNCTTKQDFTMDKLSWVRTRSQEICHESRTNAEYACQTYAEPICRLQGTGCGMGGIVPNTATVDNGSYSFTFDGSTLTLKNDVTATNRVTAAAFRFTVADIGLIDQFAIKGIHSDNWVGLRLNGVYLGTHSRGIGGWSSATDRLAIESVANCYFNPETGKEDCTYQNKVRYSATGYGALETGDNLYTDEYINILPYLKEGENVMEMAVVNGKGPGYGYVYIAAHQNCILCDYPVTNQCAAFEAAK